jgi:hypothetical protein
VLASADTARTTALNFALHFMTNPLDEQHEK